MTVLTHPRPTETVTAAIDRLERLATALLVEVQALRVKIYEEHP